MQFINLVSWSQIFISFINSNKLLQGGRMLTVVVQLLYKILITTILWLLRLWPKFLQAVLVPSQQLAMQFLLCLPGMPTETLLPCLLLLLLLILMLPLVQQLHLAQDPIVHGVETTMVSSMLFVLFAFHLEKTEFKTQKFLIILHLILKHFTSL